MKIREFKLSDANQVMALLKRSNLYHKPWDNRKNYAQKKKISPDLMLVAEENEKIIGFIMGHYDGWNAMLHRLAISKEHQGKGMGSMLADEMEKRLKKKGARNIYILAALKNKKSIKFFRKRGYYTDTKCWTMGKFV